MIDFRCAFCFEIQRSKKAPEICNHCGAKYSDWINLTTNELERTEPPGKAVISPTKPKTSTIDYRCVYCFEIQKSKIPPEICHNCGAKYSDWINLTTNEIERTEPSGKTVSPPTKPKTSAPTKPPKKTTHKTAPPPKSTPIVIYRPTGLSFSRSNFNLNIPIRSKCTETIIIRNLNKGNVTGKVTSDYYLATPRPDSFSFKKYLFLNIDIDTKTISSPINRDITISVKSTSGDYDIKIYLNVIKTTFLGGFKYFFRPWK